MTNEVVSNRKAILAKLLANENITIEFRNVGTAYFNIATRLLVLPNMKDDLSQELYNLFIGHEVGHALFTPTEYINEDLTDFERTVQNIVEDIRIERMIQTKYPGLKPDFYKGYSELLNNKFFEIDKTEVNTLCFLDRLNIYAKCGTLTDVTFSPEEQTIVDMGRDLITFDDVLKMCKVIIAFIKNKTKQKKQEPQPTVCDQPKETDQEPSPADKSGDDGDKFEGASNEPDSTKPKEKVIKLPEGMLPNQTSDVNPDDAQDEIDETETVTDKALEDNLKTLLELSKNNIITVNVPTFNLKNVIVGYKEFTSNLFLFADAEVNLNPASFNDIYKKYLNQNAPVISYMYKEFELKKRALHSQKVQINQTGLLDSKKLSQYTITPDIFRKNASTSGGKSHGLVLFIDWLVQWEIV